MFLSPTQDNSPKTHMLVKSAGVVWLPFFKHTFVFNWCMVMYTKGEPDFQSDFHRRFNVELPMQHKLVCVNLVSQKT